MLHTPLVDTVSIAALLVLSGLSVVMYRRDVSAVRHAFALAGLCGCVLAAWIVMETWTRIATNTDPFSMLRAANVRPRSVVTELTIPMVILLFLGGWHMLTRQWHASSPRLLAYTIHWIILLCWLAVSLLEPTNVFATMDVIENLAPVERVAFMQRNLASRHIYEQAVLGYLALVLALFFLPLALCFRRQT